MFKPCPPPPRTAAHRCVPRYLSRTRLQGVITHPYVLTGMTEWGGVLILIATGSTSYKNAAAKRALRNYRSLSEKDGRVLVAMATLDKPATDGASVRYLLQLKASNIPSLDLASVTITLVVTEQECDAACAAIAATGHAIAFDSEYVPVRGAAAAGVGAARKSALV